MEPLAIAPLHYLIPVLVGIVLVRYFLVSGAFFLVFYTEKLKNIRSRFYSRRKISSKFPSAKIYRMEMKYSIQTSLVFGVSGAFLLTGWKVGVIEIYTQVDQHGWAYFLFSLVFVLLAHETYFYWTHRIMHHPKIFRFFHQIHHRSVNPSPWASFSFNFLEAVVEAIAIPLIVFFIPVHIGVLLAVLTLMTVLGVVNHLGFEIYPKNFQNSLIGRWWITPSHHFLHHSRGNCNYGLYFTFWDRWMGTQDPSYEEFFDKNTFGSSIVKVVGLEGTSR